MRPSSTTVPRRRSWATAAAALVALSIAAITVPGVSGAQTSEPDSNDTAELRPGVVVVDTVHGERSADHPAVAPFIEASEREVDAFLAERAELLDGQAARVGSGLTVSYVRASTPNDVRQIVDTAVGLWNDALLTTPGGPLEMTFNWASFGGDTSLLGFAGPSAFRSDGPSFIPIGLSNTLDGVDRYPNGPELTVTLSSDLYNRPNDGWYVGTGDVPAGKIDLFSTVLHEIGHGLGFLGSARVPNGQTQPRLEDPPDRFDTLALFGTTPLLSFADAESRLTSGNIWIDIGAGRRHQLYAPFRFLNGSSYSHFDESRYPTGTAGSLMTPALNSQEIERTLDAATLGVMSGIGWPMQVGAVQPKNLELRLNADTGTAILDWAPDLIATGTPPLSYRVEVIQGSSVIRSTTVGGAVESASFQGLVRNATYTFRVTPNGNRGDGIPAERTVRFSQRPEEPRLVTVTGGGLDRTVTWVEPEDNGKNITGYTVSIATDGGAFQRLGQTSTTSISTGPLAEGVHQFRVTATNADGTSNPGASLPVGFSDGMIRPVALDGQIARLYQAYFERLPDAGGFDFFVGQRAQGVELSAISNTFANSDEFIDRYGALDNGQFIDLVYNNVLGRNADVAGRAFWTTRLDIGVSRGDVMIGFAESPEFTVRSGIPGFQTTTEGLVQRIYFAFFLRLPDTGGFDFWRSQIESGLSAQDMANQFLDSPEFRERYGALDNRRFLELIYENVLTRAPDQFGIDFWVGRMNNGLDRGSVMLSFANSEEFVRRTGTVL